MYMFYNSQYQGLTLGLQNTMTRMYLYRENNICNSAFRVLDRVKRKHGGNNMHAHTCTCTSKCIRRLYMYILLCVKRAVLVASVLFFYKSVAPTALLLILTHRSCCVCALAHTCTYMHGGSCEAIGRWALCE